MKTQIIIHSLLCLFIISCSSSKNTLVIPANGQYEVENPPFKNYNATLNKKTISDVDVKVISRETGEQIKGFGLGIAGEATIFVEEENKLVIKNNSNKKVKIKNVFNEVSRSSQTIDKESKSDPSITNASSTSTIYIDFNLRNNSTKSIPLIIPTVMNPNLSPVSNSGVSLKIGQEIFFKYKGKKRGLLTVTDDIKNGDVLDVAQLIKKRKKEIDSK